MPPILKVLTIAVVTLISFSTSAQNIDTSDTFDFECPIYNRVRALKDIESGKPILFLQGASATIFSKDKKFSQKYLVTFDNYDCVAPAKKECMLAYNKVVFEYLDKTFGIGWRKEVRKDILGFPKYYYRVD